MDKGQATFFTEEMRIGIGINCPCVLFFFLATRNGLRWHCFFFTKFMQTSPNFLCCNCYSFFLSFTVGCFFGFCYWVVPCSLTRDQLACLTSDLNPKMPHGRWESEDEHKNLIQWLWCVDWLRFKVFFLKNMRLRNSPHLFSNSRILVVDQVLFFLSFCEKG